MKNKRKKRQIRRQIFTITIIGVVMLPVRVHGSTQISKIEEIKEIYDEISSGEVESALRRILELLGLIDPAEESEIDNSEEDNPYANPETPEEVWELENYEDIHRSRMPQKMSQIVFSKSGQEIMAAESEQVQAIESASYEAQQLASTAYDNLDQIATENIDYSNKIIDKASEAKAAKASQDVLKALAAQNQEIGQMLAGNSEQLAYLGEIATHQSFQLSGLSSQLSVLNGKTQVLQVLAASQNSLMSQVDSSLRQQREYQQYKDSLDRGVNQRMSQTIFIPGLFKDNSDVGSQ